MKAAMRTADVGQYRPLADDSYRDGNPSLEPLTMTVPKKNSRPIEVDAVPLRYMVSVSKADEAGLRPMNLTVQMGTGRGRILKAHGLFARDFWLDFPEVEVKDRYPVLKPADVSAVVRLARANGWNPAELGPPFLFEISSDALRR